MEPQNSPNLRRARQHTSESSHWTQVPNEVLDRLLPELKGAPIAVLLVVIRQTLGWRESGRKYNRSRAWISHSWFKRHTGYASASISRAIEVLVQRGVIIVTSESGVTLATPHNRRRLQGRLYFDLGPKIESYERIRSEPFDGSTSKTENRESKTIKEKHIKVAAAQIVFKNRNAGGELSTMVPSRPENGSSTARPAQGFQRASAIFVLPDRQQREEEP